MSRCCESYITLLRQRTNSSLRGADCAPSPGETQMSKDTKLLDTLHAALMPDYNRAAAIYWWGLLVVGASVIAVAILEASLRPLASQLQIVAVSRGNMKP